jgi:hypothetical protein
LPWIRTFRFRRHSSRSYTTLWWNRPLRAILQNSLHGATLRVRPKLPWLPFSTSRKSESSSVSSSTLRAWIWQHFLSLALSCLKIILRPRTRSKISFAKFPSPRRKSPSPSHGQEASTAQAWKRRTKWKPAMTILSLK